MTHKKNFEARVNEVLDERRQLSADEQLRALSREDAASRKLLDAYAAMLEGVDSLESPRAPEDMGERVLAQLTRPAVVRFPAIQSPFAQRVAALAAIAAALLIAVAWWQYGSPGDAKMAKRGVTAKVDEPIAGQKDGDNETSNVATADAATQKSDATKESRETVNAPADDPPLGTMVRDTSEAYAQLVRDTQKSMADLALLFPSLGRAKRESSPSQQPPTDIQTSPEGSPAPTWMNQMNDGLRPITSATSGAFNMLLRSLPAETKESDS